MEDSRIRLKIQPVIFAGGKGSRLWPLSHQEKPKQFQRLISDHTMLQLTVMRVREIAKNDLVQVLKPIIFIRSGFEDLVTSQLLRIGATDFTLITEPNVSYKEQTGTASLACIAAQYSEENAIMVTLPCDHYFADVSDFVSTVVDSAFMAVEYDSLVMLSSAAKEPHTGYGYLQVKEGVVKSIREKPEYKEAINLIQSGHLWNVGVYVGRVRNFIATLSRANRSLFTVTRTLAALTRKTVMSDIDVYELEKTYWLSLEVVSMEEIAVRCLHFLDIPFLTKTINTEWGDVGSFKGMHVALSQNKENVLIGKGHILNSISCLGVSKTKPIVMLGLRETVVVETDKMILVTNLNSSEDVGLAKEHVEHQKKSWGYYDVISRSDRELVKIMTIYPKESISLQKHDHRSEEWTIMAGSAEVRLNDKTYRVKAGDVVFVPVGWIHKVTNVGSGNLTILEKQVGDFIDESDIVRYDHRDMSKVIST